MELQFNKVGSRWETEFEATGNFNLHIERKKAGGLAIYQKASADDKYATDSSWSDNAPAVVNKDFSMLIYPKMIKVTSRSEPVQAIVTMEGESGGSGNLTFSSYLGVIYNSDPNEENFIEVQPNDDGYYTISRGAPSLSNSIEIPAKVVISEFVLIPLDANTADFCMSSANYTVKYVDDITCIDIKASTFEVGGSSPTLKFKLMEIIQ